MEYGDHSYASMVRLIMGALKRLIEQFPLAQVQRRGTVKDTLAEPRDSFSKLLLDLRSELRKQLVKGNTE
jgi:hypothetical protein